MDFLELTDKIWPFHETEWKRGKEKHFIYQKKRRKGRNVKTWSHELSQTNEKKIISWGIYKYMKCNELRWKREPSK